MLDYSIVKFFDKDKLFEVLLHFDNYFSPKLSTIKDLEDYAQKLSFNAFIITAKKDNKVIGFLAFYFNPAPKSTFLTLLAVDQRYQGRGIGKKLIGIMVDYSKKNCTSGILLEMRAINVKALKIYSGFGFSIRDEFKSPFNGEKKYHLYLNLNDS